MARRPRLKHLDLAGREAALLCKVAHGALKLVALRSRKHLLTHRDFAIEARKEQGSCSQAGQHDDGAVSHVRMHGTHRELPQHNAQEARRVQKGYKAQGCQALALSDAHHERPYQAICKRHAHGARQELHRPHRRNIPTEHGGVKHEQRKRNIEEAHEALRGREKHGSAACTHDKPHEGDEKRTPWPGMNLQVRRGQRAAAAKNQRHESAQHVHPGRIVMKHVGKQLSGVYRLTCRREKARAHGRAAGQLAQNRQHDKQYGPKGLREKLAYEEKDGTQGR